MAKCCICGFPEATGLRTVKGSMCRLCFDLLCIISRSEWVVKCSLEWERERNVRRMIIDGQDEEMI